MEDEGNQEERGMAKKQRTTRPARRNRLESQYLKLFVPPANAPETVAGLPMPAFRMPTTYQSVPTRVSDSVGPLGAYANAQLERDHRAVHRQEA